MLLPPREGVADVFATRAPSCAPNILESELNGDWTWPF